MFWKNWPYWLKGGFLAACIIVVFMIFSDFLGNNNFIKNNILFIVLLIPRIPSFLFVNTIGESIIKSLGLENLYSFIVDLFNVIFYFAAGAIIGLAYGKNK